MGCISVSAKCSNLVSVSVIIPRYESTIVICVLVLCYFFIFLTYTPSVLQSYVVIDLTSKKAPT